MFSVREVTLESLTVAMLPELPLLPDFWVIYQLPMFSHQQHVLKTILLNLTIVKLYFFSAVTTTNKPSFFSS